MSETPSALLRRAVARMRADADRCGDVPGSFIPAVADMLDHTATLIADNKERFGGTQSTVMAIIVARAYLDEVQP